MEFFNEHGNHPVLSHCIFVPFSIDHHNFCSLIHMNTDFLRNVQHVEIHGLSDIDVELHLGNYCEDGENYSNTIRELLLGELDID
jgi:hypothetical protein